MWADGDQPGEDELLTLMAKYDQFEVTMNGYDVPNRGRHRGETRPWAGHDERNPRRRPDARTGRRRGAFPLVPRVLASRAGARSAARSCLNWWFDG